MSDKRHPIYQMSKEEVLEQLLGKQCRYYEAVLELSEQESGSLSRGKLEAIPPVMRKKQILMQCINELDLAMRPLKEYWNSTSERSCVASESVKQKLEELGATIKKILDLDQQNQQLFEEQMSALKK